MSPAFMSQAATLSRLGAESQFSGIGKVMVVRVFVAGGTGVIGRRLVPQLVARDHQVTATTGSSQGGWINERGVIAKTFSDFTHF